PRYLGTAYIGGILLSQLAVSAASTTQQARVGRAAIESVNIAKTFYVDEQDNPLNAVGHSFAGATRLFSAGNGSYKAGINEFIENKAIQFPLLRVKARTSKAY
ncbi:23180_t:CDS:2, partial [Gigaspora rosea]